jgi:Flp pilus assembly protein TadG
MRMVMPDPTRAPFLRSARRAQRSERGQTMVEVGLILPIFLITLLAIIEFGWWAAVASATGSASREAARYGSTVGTVGTPAVERYRDCPGIRNAARSTTGALLNLPDGDIIITYDNGSGTAVAVPCVSIASRPDADQIDRWDRVVVEVRVTYDPLVPIFDVLIGTRQLVSIDRRSIVKAAP